MGCRNNFEKKTNFEIFSSNRKQALNGKDLIYQYISVLDQNVGKFGKS